MAKLIKLAKMAGVMHEADHAYTIWSKPLFHSYLIAKGTKKRDAPSAPSAARKGGGGEWAAAIPNQG